MISACVGLAGTAVVKEELQYHVLALGGVLVKVVYIPFCIGSGEIRDRGTIGIVICLA